MEDHSGFNTQSNNSSMDTDFTLSTVGSQQRWHYIVSVLCHPRHHRQLPHWWLLRSGLLAEGYISVSLHSSPTFTDTATSPRSAWCEWRHHIALIRKSGWHDIASYWHHLFFFIKKSTVFFLFSFLCVCMCRWVMSLAGCFCRDAAPVPPSSPTLCASSHLQVLGRWDVDTWRVDHSSAERKLRKSHVSN